MTGLGILEVAIGLIFTFSLLSIIATTMNTIIANVFKTRARHLKRGLETLISDPDIRKQFMSHPLINLVREQPRKRSRFEEWLRFIPNLLRGRRAAEAMMSAQMVAQETASLTKVDWIDPDLFSKVLTDILAEKAALTLYIPLSDAVQMVLTGAERARMEHLVELLQAGSFTLDEFQREIYRLADPADRDAMQQALNQVDQRRKALELNPHEGSRVIPILEGLRQVNDPAFRKAIKVLVASARSLEEAQSQLETWFDQRMQQLSGVYKRNLTMFSLLIGLFLSVVLNADTLQIARTLFDDPSLRAALVAAANQAVESGQLEQLIPTATPEPTLTPTFEPTSEAGVLPPETPEPLAEEFSTQSAEGEPTPTPEDNPLIDTADAITTVNDVLNQLLQLNLPISWEYSPLTFTCFVAEGETLPPACDNTRNLWLYVPGNTPNWFGLVLRKLLGIALTTLAVAQGAPFWFDLLNRLVRGNK
ncbi:MAG: hypothetical protein IAE80_23630 [Anaerolinea sp.]|nr:hypothetical protein [Anaerolinea sp.]